MDDQSSLFDFEDDTTPSSHQPQEQQASGKQPEKESPQSGWARAKTTEKTEEENQNRSHFQQQHLHQKGDQDDGLTSSSEGPHIYATSFHWTEGGHKVLLAGSFTKWREGALEMQPESEGSRVFSLSVDLPEGIHSYKYIVDGLWKFAIDQPQIADAHGNVNNCISVTRPFYSSHDYTVHKSWETPPKMKHSTSSDFLTNQLLLPGVTQVPRTLQSQLKRQGRSNQRPTPTPTPTPTPSPSSSQNISLNQSNVSNLTSSFSPKLSTLVVPPSISNASSSSSSSSSSSGLSMGSMAARNAALLQSQKNQSGSVDPTKSLSTAAAVKVATQKNESDDFESSQDLSIFTYAYGTSPGSGKLSILRNKMIESRAQSASIHGLAVVMVGLPARGKSFVARKLCRYLNWMGFNSKVFNLGNYRRERLGSFHSHDFFRPDNPEAAKSRDDLALLALEDVFSWFRNDNGLVAIFDGTNSTCARRKLILGKIKEQRPSICIKTIFVEVICDNPDIINANIRATKLTSPDYTKVDPERVVEDFKARIEHYERAYETLGKYDDYHYIKIFDVGKQIVANRITGFVPTRIMFFLSNLHIIPRPIYLVRHGESESNRLGRLGGDSDLTENGQLFAEELREWVLKQIPDAEQELIVWSSTMIRTVSTAEIIPNAQYVKWKVLEEINAGICDGMTYEEIEQKYPEEFTARSQDKLRYRYPMGESYEDLVRRLEPVIIELERLRKPILIVGHRATLRCLYGYLCDKTRDDVPHLSLPLHTVVKLTPTAYGTQEERFRLMDGYE